MPRKQYGKIGNNVRYSEWMSDTAVFGRARSRELKQVDHLLKICADDQEVSNALQVWKDSKLKQQTT